MIIVVDFDGTLALGNKSHITLAEPNYQLISKLHKLKKELNVYIKIVTARGAKNHLNLEEKQQRYLHLIKEFCELYNIPYDEISFNKEYGDLYIDDMTIGQFDNFYPLKSPFTHNNIILTDYSVIKKSKTSLFEKNWYELAAPTFYVPKILFCNDNTIITEKIESTGTVSLDMCINILNKFRDTHIYNFNYGTYIDNLPNIQYSSKKTISVIEYVKNNILQPTFFHGDFTRSNLINCNDHIFLIDPNYKYIFGNYLTDAAKLYFSIVAYEQNINEANNLIKYFGNDLLYYAVAEGLRVCKYNANYISIVNNIADMIV
jgi:hypothetical protein